MILRHFSACRSAFSRFIAVAMAIGISVGAVPFSSTPALAVGGAGGTISSYSSGGNLYTVHSFTSTGTTVFTTPTGVTSVEYLIVGAGGGGGAAWIDQTGGSGGGGGQVLTGTATVTPETDYNIVVGTGGTGGLLTLSPSISPASGTAGGSSSAFGITAGGGGGAIKSYSGFGSPGTGLAGSSGGGLFAGAAGIANGYCQRGGGGGGASAAGTQGNNVSSGATDNTSTGSRGGAGVGSDIRTGTVQYYGGGGGGAGTGNCAQSGLAGGGGLGGGGNSATYGGRGVSGTCCSGYDGAVNTGGGGGGQSGYMGSGGNGGSGIVVVRYLAPQAVTWAPSTSLTTTGSPATPTVLASALGGATLSYSVVSHTSTSCSVNASTGVLTYTGAGNCVVRATAAATGALGSASQDVTFTISKVSQSNLTLTSTTGSAGSSLSLATSGGSGNGAVSYAVTGTGTASGCAVSGSTLTVTSTGTCKITATKASDATYLSESSAETTVTFGQGTQPALAITSTSGTVGQPLTITVTGGSGNGAITYELLSGGTTTCTISSGSLLTGVAGTCLIKVTKAADSSFAAQSTTGTVTFSVAVQQSQSQVPAVTSTTTPGVIASAASTASTTTTSTTIAQKTATAPAAPAIAEVGTGEGALEVDGQLVEGTTTRVNNQLVVSAGDMTVTVSSVDSNGNVLPLDENGMVLLDEQSNIRVSATGFKTDSEIAVWMFSTPTLLGTIKANTDGTFESQFSLPKNVSGGKHRIALIGKDANGKDSKFAVGVLVGVKQQLSTTAKVLIAVPITLAVILGLLLPTQLRRRRRRNA